MFKRFKRLSSKRIQLFQLLKPAVCPGGEIGRRTAFRWQRSQGCAGSNPVPGTNKKALTETLLRLFLYIFEINSTLKKII